MRPVEPVTLERAPVRLVPLGHEHVDGLKAAAADGQLWTLRYTSVPEPERTVARANIVLYFAFTDIISFATYSVSGILSVEVFKLALIVGPVYALGLFIGSRLFGVASETLFRRVCYSLIALAAIVALPLLDPILGR